VRKDLSADALIDVLHDGFSTIPDPRGRNATIPLADVLMSAFAMFSLKEPSLLAFDERRSDENIKNLYKVGIVPSDTRMREILDSVPPELLNRGFVDLFRCAQRGKALEKLRFIGDAYLVSMDGTGYFSSPSIHCNSCLTSISKGGEIRYSHQMVSAAIVRPGCKTVVPLGCEAIVRADGSTKNDCERNASKRLLRRLREQHPRLKMIVVEDGLASNGPHIRELIDLRMHFILGAKPGDHGFLVERYIEAYERGEVTGCEFEQADGNKMHIDFVNGLPLNEANQDLKVNYLVYMEIDASGTTIREFSWVTDLKITRENCQKLVAGARARWKIENEVFNTLKNQGYHFEHNFGHGKQYLSVVLATLMMLAFLVDQLQALACPLFQAVKSKLRTKRSLWDNLRSHFRHFIFRSFEHLYRVILHDQAKELPLFDSS
jgi:hypothetical protein